MISALSAPSVAVPVASSASCCSAWTENDVGMICSPAVRGGGFFPFGGGLGLLSWAGHAKVLLSSVVLSGLH